MVKRRQGRSGRWPRALMAVVVTGGMATAFAASPAASGAPSFEPGQGSAQAFGLVIDPRAGQLSVGLRLAESLADYLGTVGRGQATGMDLGVIGTTLTTPNCQGTTIARQDQLPPTVHVDSRDASAPQGKTVQQYGTPASSPFGAALSLASARATQQPMGWSHATISALQLSPGLVVGAGDSTAQAAVLNGATRDANAEANISSVSLGGGAVVLKGLHWTADQQTGASTAFKGGFSLDGMTVGGAALPTAPDALSGSFAAANAALAPLGLRIDAPAVQHDGSGVTGHMAVAPLSVGVYSSPLGNQLLGPVLSDAHAVREAVIAQLLKVYCPAEAGITIADITLSSLTGGGSFALEFGGVDARTDGTTYANPFADIGLGTAPPADVLSSSGGGADTSLTGLGAGPSLGGGATPAAPSQPRVSPAPRRQVAAPASTEAGHVGLWAGIVAVLLALALALGDVFWERRGRHRIPEEVFG